MKHFFTLLIGLLLVLTTEARPRRTKLYRAIVKTQPGSRVDGILYQVTDSVLYFIPNTTEAVLALRQGKPDVLSISAAEIEKIVIRRKGSTGRAVLIGAGAGLLPVPFVLASMPPIPGRDTDFLGLRSLFYLLNLQLLLTFPVIGAQYGALVSIIPRKTYRIGQRPDLYRGIRPNLQKFSYHYQETQRNGTPNPSGAL